MISKRPQVFSAVPTKRSAKSASVTLPVQATALPPSAMISATTSSAGAVSRSLTTTAAPSRCSFRAISRPMPRPEPETMATLPSSFLLMFIPSISGGQGDDSVAGELDFTRLVAGGDFQANGAAGFVLLDDLAGAGDDVAEMGDGAEAHAEFTQLTLVDPLGQQAAEVGHRQHAVGEYVAHAGFLRIVDVDMNRVVVVRRTGEQRQGGAVDRCQDQLRQGVANVDGGKIDCAHG